MNTTELIIFLLFLEIGYIALARRLRIGVHTHERAKWRNASTPSGGGVIFIIAAFCSFFSSGVFSQELLVVMGGGLLLSVVSFVDDVRQLPVLPRLVVQVLVSAAVGYNLLMSGKIDVFIIMIFALTGLINSFNFIDGVNGMLGCYSAVTLLFLAFLSTGASPELSHICMALFWACLVLLVFNFRRKALIFSGDVGSITLGFFIGVSLLTLICRRSDLSMLILVSVLVTDTLCTYLHRLFNGEKVMHPHRKHLYQHLVLNRGISPLLVSVCYSGVQLLIDLGWYYVPQSFRNVYAIIMELVILTAYILLKQGGKAGRH